MKITDKVKQLQESQNGSPEKGPKEIDKKTKMIMVGVIAVMLIVGFTIISGGKDDDNTGDAKDPGIVETPGIDKPEAGDKDESGSSDKVDTGKQDLTTDDVKDNNMQRPDSPLEKDEIGSSQENLEGALDYLDKLESDETFDPLESRGLDKTPRHILSNIRMALNLGYKFDYDGIVWYASSRDNVYQFMIPMTKEGDANVILSGNYINTTGDVNIDKFEGNPDPSDLVSPGDVPQDGN